MTFDSPWALSLGLLPLIWAAAEWRRSERRRWLLWESGGVRTGRLGHGPSHEWRFLGQESPSRCWLIPRRAYTRSRRPGGGQRLAAWRQLEAEILCVLLLSIARPVPAGLCRKLSWSEVPGTNLEAAVRNGLTLFPPEHVARMVLISDGKENLGAVERALYQARRRGIPIDTVGLEGRRETALRVTSLAAPTRAYAGEWFTMEASVNSPRSGEALVELMVEGKSISRWDR